MISLYGYSPYKACAHACAYCDGRAEKYWVEGDFGRDIAIKRDVPILLNQDLAELREPGIVAAGSGITDVYQPVEAREGLMREAARVIADHGRAGLVLTKSALVRRDIDQWKRVAERGGFMLWLTITTLDAEVAARFEPGASTPQERLDTLAEFRAAGIHAGVLAMPLLPYIGDTAEAAGRLFDACRDAGADFVMPGGLTLRPGRQKEHYMSVLNEYKPELVSKYHTIYENELASGNCVWNYRIELQKRISGLIKERALSPLAPHAIYRDMMPPWDEVLILLCHMEQQYMVHGVDITRLSKSLAAYREWFRGLRRWFRSHRSLDASWLPERFMAAFESDEIDTVLANSKLSDFVRKVVLERAVFDYRSMKLVEG